MTSKQCPVCSKVFKFRKNMLRHMRTVHNAPKTYKCESGKLELNSNKGNLNKECNKRKSSTINNTDQPKKKLKHHNEYHCDYCDEQFTNKSKLMRHILMDHLQTEKKLIAMDDMSETDKASMLHEYQINKGHILAPHMLTGNVKHVYNYPLSTDGLTQDIVMEHLREIYAHESGTFKVNAAMSRMLKNTETGKFRVFKGYEAERMLLRSEHDEEPYRIDGPKDVDKCMAALMAVDLQDYSSANRPDTKWQLVMPTNVSYHVVSTGFLLGGIVLPNWIQNKKCLITEFLKHHQDNLCAFRCLAYHYSKSLHIKFLTTKLFWKWVKYIDGADMTPDTYTGLSLSEIPDFEQCFNVNINVYELSNNDHVNVVYKSQGYENDLMNLNVNFDAVKKIGHLSYIKNFASYAKRHKCNRCGSLFDQACNRQRHEKRCMTSQHNTDRYKGGFYSLKPSVWDQMEMRGIAIPQEEENKYYDLFACFQFEVEKKNDNYCSSEAAATVWLDQHNIVGVSILSSMGHNVRITNNKDDMKLIDEMLTALEWIQQAAKKYLTEQRWPDVIAQLRDHPDLMYKFVDVYCSRLPVLSYNFANYQVKLALPALIKSLKKRCHHKINTIKRAGNYSCIRTNQFIFLDLALYQAPDTTLEEFLASELNQLSPAVTLNNIMLATERMIKCYSRENKIDALKTTIGLAGISRQFLFQSCFKHQDFKGFVLTNKANADMERLIENNIVGGPSIVYVRYHNKGETPIRLNGEKVCQKIEAYDANGLYLWALSREQPVGTPVRWKYNESKGRFLCRKIKPGGPNASRGSFDWLDWYAAKEGVHVEHLLNRGSEYKIGNYAVDGWIESTRTALEYYGCYWHSCDCVKKTEKNEAWLKRRADLRTEKLNFLKQKGVTVIEMWACQWQRLVAGDKKLKAWTESRLPYFYSKYRTRKVTQTTLLEFIECGKLFGMVECDLHVPNELLDKFNDMCPLFGNVDVPFEAIGQHMQDYIIEKGLHQKPRRQLISTTKAVNVLLATPLLMWYLEHGLVVTKIHQVIEYSSQACFNHFAHKVTEARRSAIHDKTKTAMAAKYKLLGNSAFGSLLMNKSRFRQIRHVESDKVYSLTNNKRFRRLDELGDNLYEVTLAKSSIHHDLPKQVGFFVLQYAKLRILQFYYDFIDTMCHKADFELCYIDTDCLSMALSGEKLSDIIKAEKQNEFNKRILEHCRDDWTPDYSQHFLLRACCDNHKKVDRVTCGLYKVEYEGSACYNLCSKTYRVADELNQTVKFASSGLNRQAVDQGIYKNVLDTRDNAVMSVNRGQLLHKGRITDYKKKIKGFNYLYVKRQVMSDGVHTTPLQLTINPLM